MADLRSIAKSVPGLRRLVLRRRRRAYLSALANMPPVGTGRKVLVINHHFDQDIAALTQGCADALQFLPVDCMPLFNEALLYFPTREMQDGIVPYPKVQPAAKEGYRAICREIFRELHGIFPFEVVLMPSDSFWWLREFLAVCGEQGIPRVVLDKEGIIAPFFYDNHPGQIREKFPFMSDRLLVWSARQKDYWTLAEAPPDCITVVGQPRSDFFFDKSRWPSREDLGLSGFARHVLFFSFSTDAYIHLLDPEEIRREALSWMPLRDEINSVLVRFAAAHPNIRVTIKVHPQQSDIELMRDVVVAAGLRNLVLEEGASLSNALIVNSDIIIGFQTTAMIEAMLTDKPILYTAWGETERKVRHHLIPLHEMPGMEWVRSSEALMQALARWEAGHTAGGNRTLRRRDTDFWLGADGKVAERIKAALAAA